MTFSPPTEFLAGIGKEQLLEILGAARVRKIGTEHVILNEGHTAKHLFLLKSGRAKFYRLTRKGDEVLLALLVPGDTFGLGTLLSRPVPYVATAETTRDSEFLVWDQARIRALARKYPRLAQNALGIVCRYLAAHFDRLFDLVTGTASERLARVVLQMSRETGTVVPSGVEIAATNEELGALADISPFTVSRVLTEWARTGALAKSRGKVFIQSPEKLMGDTRRGS
jgi:CRP/FNR family transcriptional regulator, nitrogen oxide reductase regulator